MKEYVIVDDDRTNNVICQLTIKKFAQDAWVHIFSQHEECLNWFVENQEGQWLPKQTILFLDINMSTMTGWEFLDEFKNLNEEIRSRFNIYILSSSLEDFSEKAKVYPFVSGFLSKPLRLSHLETIKLTSEKA